MIDNVWHILNIARFKLRFNSSRTVLQTVALHYGAEDLSKIRQLEDANLKLRKSLVDFFKDLSHT